MENSWNILINSFAEYILDCFYAEITFNDFSWSLRTNDKAHQGMSFNALIR